tara:strand:- start:218 stop:1333 length:1116 start_codon:yes stop_codon:yes gene_type:complete
MSRARTFADLATASEAGNLNTANLVINGDMSVAQRGTSSTSTLIQTVDRWGVSFGGVAVTQTQQSLTSGSPYESGFNNFIRAANTSTSSSTTSYIQFYQRIEAQHIANSGWNFKSSSSFITLSFWARSSLQGTYYAFVVTDDGTDYYRSKAFALSADTWTKVTFTIEGNSNLTINDDNGIGFTVNIVPHYGTSYTGSNANTTSWYTLVSNDYMPDFAQNWSESSGATFDVTGVQLELGQVATPYKHENFADNLLRCQRYYFKCGLAANTFMGGAGWARDNNSIHVSCPYPVTMRVAPTALETSGTSSDYEVNYRALSATVSSGPSFDTANRFGAFISADVSGTPLTAGDSLRLVGSSGGGTDSFLAWSAEL